MGASKSVNAAASSGRSAVSSPRSATSVLLSSVSLAVCLHGLYGTVSLPLPAYLQPAGQFQFLTNLASLLSCTVLTLDLVVPSLTPQLWLCIVCNIELVVTTAYWVLIFFFSHFLNTGAFDVPLLLDLEIHLFPYIALTNATKRNARRYANGGYRTLSFKKSTICTFAVLASYWTYIEYMVSQHNIRYPYPFLNDTTLFIRLAWIFVFGAVSSSNYYVQRLLEAIL